MRFELADFESICVVNECTKKAIAKGLCRKHYQEEWRLDNQTFEKTEESYYPLVYYNTTPVIVPEDYDQDNIVCQWLKSHHT